MSLSCLWSWNLSRRLGLLGAQLTCASEVDKALYCQKGALRDAAVYPRSLDAELTWSTNKKPAAACVKDRVTSWQDTGLPVRACLERLPGSAWHPVRLARHPCQPGRHCAAAQRPLCTCMFKGWRLDRSQIACRAQGEVLPSAILVITEHQDRSMNGLILVQHGCQKSWSLTPGSPQPGLPGPLAGPPGRPPALSAAPAPSAWPAAAGPTPPRPGPSAARAARRVSAQHTRNTSACIAIYSICSRFVCTDPITSAPWAVCSPGRLHRICTWHLQDLSMPRLPSAPSLGPNVNICSTPAAPDSQHAIRAVTLWNQAVYSCAFWRV